MKKISMILGGVILVLAAGCQKLGEGVTPDNTDAPQAGEEQNVELFATLPVRRTTLSSDFKLAWNKSDDIAVFNAPTGTENYSGNLKFIIDEDATGRFTPAEGVEVPFEDGVNYDWFVCCPYRVLKNVPELTTPKGESKEDGYFPIGYQTQTGYNSAVHIGGVDIMVGKATNTRTPDVDLKHLAVLHKFTVTNNSDKPTVITKLTFNGGENKLFGAFWIDLTADEPSIDINKATNTYNQRDLTVNNGTELAVGESADFYMMTAPFTLNIGETLMMTIETSTGTQVIEKTATADMDFKAGTYNTASLVYDYVPDYADHLYSDTFNGTFANSEGAHTGNSTFTPARWDTYDKGGMTVYDGDLNAVSYTHDSNSCLSRYVASALVGMNDLYIWFKDGGVVTVSGIKLHGYTSLNLSFIQTYKSSGIKSEYSVDGETWEELGTTSLENSAYAYDASYDFEVPDGSETISLRFTATSTPRIDNIKLTWQTK